ncbi:hypothetical protein ACWKWC_15820 [Geodermatophilus nigrescens]
MATPTAARTAAGTAARTPGRTAAAAPTEQEAARRAWPLRAALGVALLVVAVVAVVAVLTGDLGARLLLGALGVLAAARGAQLLRAGSAVPGGLAVAGGLAAVAVAAVSAPLTGWVLLLGVPLALVGAAAVALARGGAARRGGLALQVWALLAGGLLAATALVQGTGRAADVATVVAALATGVAGVPLLVAAAGLRTVARQPAPARPLGCGGCACSAGGCGSA